MQRLDKPVLGLVLPCYNEEQVLPLAAERLAAELAALVADDVVDASSYICFVDDGSSDRSWQIIEQLAAGDVRFRGLKLSRNYGHQYALYAGLMEADADAVTRAITDGLQEAAHRWLDPTLPRVRFVADTSVVRRWSDAK